MSTSSREYFLLNASAKARVEASLARSTSSSETREFPDCRTMSCRAASPRVALRHAMTTVPPKRARPKAVASPIPEFAPVTRNTRSSIVADILSTSGALDVDHGNPASHEDAHDDRAVSSVGIHIAVHQARRDVEEIPGTDCGHLGPFRSVLESELTRDQESVEFAGAMMMPTRNRSTV